jgi:hypothetical protein
MQKQIQVFINTIRENSQNIKHKIIIWDYKMFYKWEDILNFNVSTHNTRPSNELIQVGNQHIVQRGQNIVKGATKGIKCHIIS